MTGGILLLFTTSILGQLNYQPGYIITNNLDSITGNVLLNDLGELQAMCKFKNKEVGIKTYLPGEISGFGFNTGQRFESQQVDGKLVFMQKLVSGKVSLFYFLHKNPRYFICKEYPPVIELKYTKELVTFENDGSARNGKLYIVEQIVDKQQVDTLVMGEYIVSTFEFRKTLKEQMSDAPELYDKIDLINEPTHGALIPLVTEYNKEDAVTYNPSIKQTVNKLTELEVAVGWSSLYYGQLKKDDRFLTFSAKFNTPMADRFMYFGYGLQYAQAIKTFNRFNSKKYHIFKLPLSLRFQYPGNRIKPYAAIGFKIYYIITKNYDSKSEFILDFVPNISLGASVKIHQNIYATLAYEQEYLWNQLYNTSSNATFGNSFIAGVVFGF